MKQLRIMRIGTLYEEFVHQLSLTKSITENEDYTSMFQAVARQFFGISDSYTYYLGKMGYETQEIFGNLPFLQKKWAEENGVRYDEKTALRNLPIIQVKSFRPDVVLINDFTVYGSSWIQELRDSCPSVKFVLSWCSTVIRDVTLLKGADAVLTSFIPLQKKFQSQGIRCHLLRHAFDKRVLDVINPQNPRGKIAFAGSFHPGNHQKRIELVNYLAGRFPLAIYSPDYSGGIRGWSEALCAQILRFSSRVIKHRRIIAMIPGIRKTINWQTPYYYASMPAIRRNNNGALFGLDMYNLMSGTDITLNCHGDEPIALGYTGNIRLFEGTGVGSCLVTDYLKNDIGELFDPEREIVCFNSPEDCGEKIRYLLDHPKKRQSIAAAGQKRTLRNHTYEERVLELLTLLTKIVR